MGLHTGEVLRVGDDFRGRTLNRASRISGVAHGGQILLSGVTAHFIRTGPEPVTLLELGLHRLRDLAEPERLWQLVDDDLPIEFPPVRSLDSFSHNLPVQRSEFVGREREVSHIVASLQQHRVVTLIGPGGVGKTRLALQAAAELPTHGSTSWFVSLGGVDDGHDVLRAIAIAAGVDNMQQPIDALRTAFGVREVQLVIDNCEHIIEGVAAAVEQLTDECRGLRVLATSREALAIEGEFVIPVRPLDPDGDALELFEVRARAGGAPIGPDQRPLARQICERLDGLPLAIELAAARVPTLGLPAIVDALDDRFWLLSGGRRRGVDRHQTMRATVEWSYQLLDDDERRLLEWLAMFPGGFELDAVRHIAAVHHLEPSAAPDLIASLVRKSMVEADLDAPVVRYRLLETVRAFAIEALRERGETQQAADAQAEWVARLTGLPFNEPCNAQVERNAIRLEREADNWRKAILTATHTRALDLAVRLCGPPTRFFLLGRHDFYDLLLPLLDLSDDGAYQREIVTAIAVASAGGADPGHIGDWRDRLNALVDEPTGASQLIDWMALSWMGDVATAVEYCMRASDDPRLSQDARDLFLGIATTDCFSLTDQQDEQGRLAERAIEAARRTKVGVTKVTCLLGAAWAMVDREPDRSMALVQEALGLMPDLPSFLQRTLPGNASRLTARIDVRLAAADLLERLEEERHPSTYVDLIPTFYATELLHRLGRPTAGIALATLATSPIASYLALRDFDELARQAAEEFEPVSLDALVELLRAELRELASTDEPTPDPN
jgi:predicted ATPase